MKLFSKSFFLLFINFLIFANDYIISGNVLDSDSETGLSNVNIFLTNQKQIIQTGELGYFNFLLENSEFESIDLTFKLIGYEDKTLKINFIEQKSLKKCDSCSNLKIDVGKVFLKVESIDLDIIEIESSFNNLDLISDINIAGSELNENLKGNIASTLSKLPNVGINSFGVAASKPSLRGFSGDRFLLTKDGSETGDLSQSSIDHAIAIDMSEVSQIDIIRGPKSLIYGPNTIGGVVNTTLSGNPKIRVDKFSSKFTLGSEFFSRGVGGLYGSYLFYIPFKNNQLNLSFNNRKYDNQSSPIGTLENTDSVMDSYKISFTNYMKNGYINFSSENFEMDYGIPPTTSGHTSGIDIPMYKKSYQFNFNHKTELGKFDLKYNYVDYKHLEILPENNYDDYELLLSKKTNNLKFEFNTNQIMLGLELNSEDFVSDGINETPVTDQSDYSLYGFYEKNINKSFNFYSSFRFGNFLLEPKYYNYISGNPNLILKDDDGNPILDQNGNFISLVREREFQNFSFSLGITKTFNNFELSSWIMQTMRAPRVEELYSDGPHLATYAFEIGNPDLESEKIYGIENSIRYESYPFNASLVTFYNYSPYFFQMTKDGLCEEAWDFNPYSIDDILQWGGHPCQGADFIDWGSAPLGWLYIYSPKGNKVEIKGYEFNFGFDLGNLNFEYDLSVVRGDDLTLNLPLSYINPTKQVFNFQFDINKIKPKLRLTKIHSQDRLGQFETRTPGAHLADLILSINKENYNLSIQFNNIFNEVYYNHLSRIKSIMPEPGRNIVVVYKFFF